MSKKLMALLTSLTFLLSGLCTMTASAEDEILANGGFESGYADWDNYGEITSSDVASGVYSMKVNPSKFPSQMLTLTPDTDYDISLKVKGTGTIVLFCDTGAVRLLRYPCVTAADTWTDNSATFNSGDNTTTNFHFICTAGEVYLDDISIKPRVVVDDPTDRNLISNPGFEEGYAGWKEYGDIVSTTAHSGTNSTRITTNKYPSQYINVEKNKDYTVKFYVKGSGTVVAFSDAIDNSARQFRLPCVNNADTWTENTTTFNSGNYEQVNIHFICTVNDVYIDDVTVEAVEDSPVEPEKEEIILTDEKLSGTTITASIKSDYDEGRLYTAYAAVYDGTGRLKEVKSSVGTALTTAAPISISMTEVLEADSVKLFIWQGIGGVKPYIPAKAISAGNPIANQDSIKIAFLGGSLVETGNTWLEATRSTIEDKSGATNVTYMQNGIGGTRSDYGASRVQDTVISSNPDIVFIDNTVNDASIQSIYYNYSAYTEAIIRQLIKNTEHQPAIVLLHCPLPVEENSTNATYQNWKDGVRIKNELAEYYGIKTINIYDYMQRDWENNFSTQYATFTEYLHGEAGYPVDNNVHNGYGKYAEAINEFLNTAEGWDAATTPITELPEATYTTGVRASYADATYTSMFVNDLRLTWNGTWTYYDHADQTILPGVYSNAFAYPQFTEGVKTGDVGTSVSFETDANAIGLACITNGTNTIKSYGITVKVDGAPLATPLYYGDWSALRVNQISDSFLDLGNTTGSTHTVEIVVPEGHPLTIGRIIEIKY